jgi:adrenodoxin-NADP+ reductase
LSEIFEIQIYSRTHFNLFYSLIEKLPVPFGLVRYGVAPDHPEVKNVINTFSKTAESPNFNFYGNISLGKDVSLDELRQLYDVVVLCYGSDIDSPLGVKGESKTNVISAREFVGWFNGLPHLENFNPDLSGDEVMLIGQGNVAIDVAR